MLWLIDWSEAIKKIKQFRWLSIDDYICIEFSHCLSSSNDTFNLFSQIILLEPHLLITRLANVNKNYERCNFCSNEWIIIPIVRRHYSCFPATRHGRVAMAAFVGYVVQSNFVFPWSTFGGNPPPGVDLSPPEQWDALPMAAQVQIIGFVGFLEWYSELSDNGNGAHYTKGGKPGQYPTFDNVPHDVPFNLYDPFKISKNRSEEDKAKGLIKEVNNGRLAMLGIFGFLSEQTIPGSVPILTGIVKPYAGEVMAPFAIN